MSKADIKVSRRLQDIAKKLEKELTKVAGQRMSFSLIVFSSSENGDTNYISNCARGDAEKSLKKVLERWEQPGNDIPAHQQH